MNKKLTKGRMMDVAKGPVDLPSGVNIRDVQNAALAGLGRPPLAEERAVEPVDIALARIAPDPIQPRRALPDTYRAQWCDGHPLEDVLNTWGREAAEYAVARGCDTPWYAWLEAPDDAALLDPSTPMHPMLRQWIELLRLAGSIYRDGLAVPVSVYPEGDHYRLLMGERRLLAFWLLTLFGHEAFATIPAVVTDQYDPFRQAAENGARQNLNAIGIARQLAVLLMVLNHVDIGGNGQADQAWYAQALDLQVPSGQGEAVAAVLGLSHPRQVSHYRRLLALPNVVWNWADDFDWPEGKLRGWLRKAKHDKDLIRMAQDEATRALGNAPARPKRTPAQRTARVVDRVERALYTLSDDKTLQALNDAQRRRLRELAKDLLKRL